MNVVVLGSTGSIGTQTLDVLERLPDRFRIVGLSAHRNRDLLGQQAKKFEVPSSRAICGTGEALIELATASDVDIVVVAVAGAAGMLATLAALNAGKQVALATKEVLVAAGSIVTAAAKRHGTVIRPIDSEHSAIFQCLQGVNANDVSTIWLTASGGPFRTWDAARIEAATLSDALRHPTWPSMGRKITIDSATMMNKGLEIIEARWLFDTPVENVQVLVHPQSVVHSLIELQDGSILAQLGAPDMRTPIQYALTWPDRPATGLNRVNLTQLGQLTFEAPDEVRFPSLRLARHAAAAGGTMPAVLNAANEAAVALFLEESIAYAEIMRLVERVMENHRNICDPTLDDILAADADARIMVEQYRNR